jgi:DNA-binding IclR family transcriptional regulator
MTDKKSRGTDRYLVPAVDQGSRILFYLAQAESPYVSLIEICTQVGIHKSKAFTILHTFQKFGLVQKNSDGKGYGLGPGLLGLSRRFLDNLSAPKLAEPMLEELARKTGATAALGLISDRNVFVAAKHEGGRPIGFTVRVGSRFPLTYGSHGKAIAAFLPKKELDELLKDEKLYFHGDPSRFDRNRLLEEMEQCRKRWYAEDREEVAPGLNFVAAPVLGSHGRPVGYVVVMGLPSPEAVTQAGPLAAETGKALSRLLGATVEDAQGAKEKHI